MIVEIQCLPSPMGPAEDPYRFIEAAIALIERSGLTYEVGPLGTSIEGPPDALWPVVRAAHEACLGAGADGVVTVLKIAEQRTDGPRMGDLVGKFRA